MILRYVAHKDVTTYKKGGWVVLNDLRGMYAGQFSVIMAKLTSMDEHERWDHKNRCLKKKSTTSITPHITHREGQLNASRIYATAWAKRGLPITAREQLKSTFIVGVTRMASKILRRLFGI